MNKLALMTILSLLFLLCCKRDERCLGNNEFSRRAHQSNWTECYPLACLSMYAVNSCCDGQCFARPSNGDTAGVNILALELKLSAVQHRGDTCVFFFDFYRIVGQDTVIYEPYSQDLASCQYNGIVVTKLGRYGFPSTLGDYTLSDIDTQFVKNALAVLRQQCLREDLTKSETLRCALSVAR